MFVTISIADDGQFISYLQRGKSDFTKVRKYIAFGDVRAEAVQALGQLGFQKVVHAKCSDDYREKFLREYNDLIGFIGKELSSREWWATHIASKNRFVSRMPELLQQFVAAMEEISRRDYEHLIILKPSWVIADSLKKILEGDSIDYLCIEDRFSKWKDITRGWSSSILSVFYNGFKILMRSIYVRIKLKDIIGKTRNVQRPRYVMKTFIYDHSFTSDQQYRDAFFGSLPDYLNGKKDVFIYGNILGQYRLCIEKIRTCQSQIILPLEAFLTFGGILKSLAQVLFCQLRLTKEATFFGYDVSAIVNNELFRTHNGISYEQYLHYHSTRRLLRTISVDTFLLTYENNPWERMCIMAVRDVAPGAVVIGYQHTVVPQASVNMFPSRYENGAAPLPDRVLTVGDAPREIMERYGTYKKGQVESSCGLRFEYLFNLPSGERKRTGQILLVLEGIFEVYKMVNYVLKELGGNARYQIRLRTHPVLPIQHFQHKLACDVHGISNLHISSSAHVKEDIEWADMVIYWGSTVALEALSMGRPAIHYEMDSVLSYDPLFECNHFKRVVSDGDSLDATIKDLYSLTDDEYDAECADAKRYLSRYFFPITEKALLRFLDRNVADSPFS